MNLQIVKTSKRTYHWDHVKRHVKRLAGIVSSGAGQASADIFSEVEAQRTKKPRNWPIYRFLAIDDRLFEHSDSSLSNWDQKWNK